MERLGRLFLAHLTSLAWTTSPLSLCLGQVAAPMPCSEELPISPRGSIGQVSIPQCSVILPQQGVGQGQGSDPTIPVQIILQWITRSPAAANSFLSLDSLCFTLPRLAVRVHF